jgi:hypothetical protein
MGAWNGDGRSFVLAAFPTIHYPGGFSARIQDVLIRRVLPSTDSRWIPDAITPAARGQARE